MCSGSHYYSFARDRTLSAEEHLICLGWPLEAIPKNVFSQSVLRDLAGGKHGMPMHLSGNCFTMCEPAKQHVGCLKPLKLEVGYRH